MGAALLGFNLMGPQVGVAAADDPSGSSTSSGTDTPGSARGSTDSAAEANGSHKDAAADDADTTTDADEAEAESDVDDADAAAGGGSTAYEHDRVPAGSGDAADDPPDGTTVQEKVTTRSNSVAAERYSSWATPAVRASSGATGSAQPNSGPPAGTTTNADLDEMTRTRRLVFNQAPTVAPVQITGRLTGPVTGTVGAVDPEGDPLTYRLTRAPREGAVQLGADGTYTYTPDSDFDGVDTFRVLAIDLGPHINLFRPRGTRANALVNQGAIKFEFNYTDGGTGWTAERQQALQRAANDLVEYFLVTSPVTLTYDVGLDEDEGALAAAGSDLINGNRGYLRTVVQNKLLSGIDSNGAAADGQIDWNFDYSWALGDTVGADDFDFVSTAMHELIHSFGFLSYVGKPGDNEDTAWSVFASFIVTDDGARPISRQFMWDTDYDPNLVGRNGGLYLGGSNAVAAYGGLVPLYTPSPWESGSSMSHLDDSTFTGANEKIMNAVAAEGLGIRVLSAVELGILKDLGYQVAPVAPASLAFVGFIFFGRQRRFSKPSPLRRD